MGAAITLTMGAAIIYGSFFFLGGVPPQEVTKKNRIPPKHISVPKKQILTQRSTEIIYPLLQAKI